MSNFRENNFITNYGERNIKRNHINQVSKPLQIVALDAKMKM